VQPVSLSLVVLTNDLRSWRLPWQEHADALMMPLTRQRYCHPKPS